MSLVFAFAEGLVLPSMIRTGLAFLHTDLDVKGPTFVGDTIYVHAEVIGARVVKKNPDRGLIRTRNTVTNAKRETVLVYQPLRLMKRRPSDLRSKAAFADPGAMLFFDYSETDSIELPIFFTI